MEKALEMGKSSAKGSFHLLLGVATSTVILAVGSIFLTRLMTPAEYGLYGVALIPSSMIILFRDWGVNSAMTRFIANFKAANKNTEVREIILAGLAFEAAAGLILTLLSIFTANYIASTIFHRPESVFFISIVSVAIFSGSLLTAAQSSFIGFEKMGLNSLTLICQSIVKAVLGPVLIILGYSVLGAVLSYTLSFLAAAIMSLIALYFGLFRPLSTCKSNKTHLSKTLKTMMKYGLPLSISSILSGILIQIFSFMMASYASDVMIGNYQAALNFSVLLTFFTIPISTVLFPAFAKLDPNKEPELVKAIFASSIKYTSMLLIPATMVIMALSTPLISTLFGERYTQAPFFLTLYVISNLFCVFGNISLDNFLSGLGETKITMRQSVLTLLIGLPLGFLLIPSFGILGVITATIVSSLPSMFWGLYWVWKHYHVKPDFKSSAKIFAAATAAAIVAFTSVNFLHFAEWIRLIIGITVFLAIYIVSAPMIGAITLPDISNLRVMLRGTGTFSKIVGIPLTFTEKIADLRTRKGKA
jgi:O-antigen/teichoic acid export membrane protein